MKSVSKWDWIILIGIGCVGYGAWLIHPALMFAAVGLVLLVIGFGGYWNEKGRVKGDSGSN